MNTDFSIAGDRKITLTEKLVSMPCPYIFLSSNFSVIVAGRPLSVVRCQLRGMKDEGRRMKDER
jgi:hypothetical protein